MSGVSKLVIKACSDNKFSSFTGEFIASINPESFSTKSIVSYDVPRAMTSTSLLKYRGSPPELLKFSLLLDSTGIIPGSSTVPVMEQIKQLKEVTYNIHKENNAPNYIRIIWGEFDFKGKLVELEIKSSKHKLDGTLVTAGVCITVLGEFVLLRQGKSGAGVESNYAKPSGASATAKKTSLAGGAQPTKENFAPTPNGINGAYSGAPPGAYNGTPDQVYHGHNSAGQPVYASSSVGGTHAVNAPGTTAPKAYDAQASPAINAGANTDAATATGNSSKRGIAGNGPGGSGGGVGGGGHTTSSDANPSTAHAGSATHSGSSPASSVAPSSPASAKNAVPDPSASSIAKSSRLSDAGRAAAGTAVAGTAAAAGLNSLRGVNPKNMLSNLSNKLNPWNRLKMLVKKVAVKAYNAGNNVIK